MKRRFLQIFAGIIFLTAGPPFLNGNDSIRDVQQQLSGQQLYFGRVDGERGPETEAAIRRFQIREGLPVTGKLDNATLAELDASAPSAATEDGSQFSTWSQPKIGAKAGPEDFERLSESAMVAGSPLESAPSWKQTAAIRAAQERLDEKGFECGAADGVPGAKTRAAIAQFQVMNQLANNGRIDGPTFAAIGITEDELTRASRSSRSGNGGSESPGIRKRAKRTIKKVLWHLGL